MEAVTGKAERYIVKVIGATTRHYNFMATDAEHAKKKANEFLKTHGLRPDDYEIEATLDKSMPMSDAERAFLKEAFK
jgi:hypothetical protein